MNSRREKSPYNACIIGLTASDRQYLYDRINRRVDVMVENGLIEECRVFYDSFTPATAYQAIGYKELVPYFEGKAELCECLDKIILKKRCHCRRVSTKSNRKAVIMPKDSLLGLDELTEFSGWKQINLIVFKKL